MQPRFPVRPPAGVLASRRKSTRSGAAPPSQRRGGSSQPANAFPHTPGIPGKRLRCFLDKDPGRSGGMPVLRQTRRSVPSFFIRRSPWPANGTPVRSGSTGFLNSTRFVCRLPPFHPSIRPQCRTLPSGRYMLDTYRFRFASYCAQMSAGRTRAFAARQASYRGAPRAAPPYRLGSITANRKKDRYNKRHACKKAWRVVLPGRTANGAAPPKQSAKQALFAGSSAQDLLHKLGSALALLFRIRRPFAVSDWGSAAGSSQSSPSIPRLPWAFPQGCGETPS